MPAVPEQVLVSRELRPSRVAILVDPADRTSIRNAIGIATSAWGGLHWPLVPVFRSVPRWWPTTAAPLVKTPGDIVSNFLQAFRPDWVLNTVEWADDPPVDPERVARIDTWGLRGGAIGRASEPLATVVRHLHETRFRFVERSPTVVGFHHPDADSLLGDVLFGCLGETEHQQNLRVELTQLLGAAPLRLEPKTLMQGQVHLDDQPALVTPLTLGTEEFRFRQPGSPRYTCLLFVSLNRIWDAVELWNLRASGVEVIAIPVPWIGRLSHVLAQLLTDQSVLCLASQRLTATEIASVREFAGRYDGEVYSSETVWRFGASRGRQPADVVVATDTVECRVDGSSLQLSSLDPPWSGLDPAGSIGGWINEFELLDDMRCDEVAAVLPHDLGRVEELVPGDWYRENVRVNRGRIVVSFDQVRDSVRIALPTGEAVFRSWLKERGLKVTISDPGRTALEISRKLGGVASLQWTIGPHRLRMLEQGTRRHHIPAQQVFRAIRDDGAEHHLRLLMNLTETGVLRAGLLVECPQCRQTNFVVPDELAASIRCERCTDPFEFPQYAPPRNWAYRPAGPFATKNFAAGAYSALLATKFLCSDFYSGSWVPSVEIEGLGELDFAVWRRERHRIGQPDSPTLFLGEAKTYDRFEPRDVERMVQLRTALGQGVICFATLRDALDDDERVAIRQAAERLAESDPTALTVVLTAAELWERPMRFDLRDRYKASLDYPTTDPFAPGPLADATQRLYL